LVKKSAIILAVGQHLTSASSEAMQSVTKKHQTLICCCVCLLLDSEQERVFSVQENCLTQILSWPHHCGRKPSLLWRTIFFCLLALLLFTPPILVWPHWLWRHAAMWWSSWLLWFSFGFHRFRHCWCVSSCLSTWPSTSKSEALGLRHHADTLPHTLSFLWLPTPGSFT